MSTVFFRLLDRSPDEKPATLRREVEAVSDGEYPDLGVRIANPDAFREVPNKPIAYWLGERVLRLFASLPPLQNHDRYARYGLGTLDDFRFIRVWWEPAPARIGSSFGAPHEPTWIRIIKGIPNVAYYAPSPTPVNYGDNGAELKRYIAQKVGSASRKVQSESLYLHEGITWPRRPLGRGAFAHVGPGFIFSDTATLLVLPRPEHWSTLAMLNSAAFLGLLHLLMPRGGRETGATLVYDLAYLLAVPVPVPSAEVSIELATHAVESFTLLRQLDTGNETSHAFAVPHLVQAPGDALFARLNWWSKHLGAMREALHGRQLRVDDIAFRLYGIDDEDRRAIEDELRRRPAKSEDTDGGEDIDEDDRGDEGEEVDEEIGASAHARSLVAALVSYLAGCAFGRWDVRFATGERAAPELPDRFAPLPVCSPGMLQGDDGLPLTQPPATRTTSSAACRRCAS